MGERRAKRRGNFPKGRVGDISFYVYLADYYAKEADRLCKIPLMRAKALRAEADRLEAEAKGETK